MKFVVTKIVQLYLQGLRMVTAYAIALDPLFIASVYAILIARLNSFVLRIYNDNNIK